MVAIIAIAVNVLLCPNLTQAVEIDWPEPNWPGIYEPNWPMFGGSPNEPMTLYLDMNSADWYDITHNTPESSGCIAVEVARKAWFWMKGEEDLKIRVEVRRKKGFAFPDDTNPVKVALKIDINQYYGDDLNAAPDWHGLKKLSLEANSDSIDVISEGVACNIHRMASATEDYGWPVWHANWCKLYVNGTFNGIFVFVEQYDKDYLQHRNIYDAHGHSWLYKHHDCDGHFVLKVGDDTTPRSQAVEALCYDPFYSDVLQTQSSDGNCVVPDDANITADMDQWVDMKRMLSSAAIDAFLANSDPLFENSNNTYFYDPNINEPNLAGKKRLYLPWDVDASFKAFTRTIYYTGSIWSTTLLDIPVFHSQYNQIMRDLLDGPLTEENIYAFLDTIQPVIAHAISVDPYDKVASASAQIATLKTWFSNRIDNVRNQVDWDEPILPPGTVLLNDAFSGATWDANWTNSGTWARDTAVYAHALPSAKAPAKAAASTLTCDDLDTSDASAIHVEFWVNLDDTDPTEDIKLEYYNGTSYVSVADLDALGAEDIWLHYTDTITDSNYFKTNFKIRFNNLYLENGENVWVDEVVITKEVPQLTALISGTILDPGTAPVAGVSVDANNAGGSDITDVNGYYELEVTSGWSGTVTPTKAEYTLNPTSRAYSNVTTDRLYQNYVATSIYDLYPDGIIDLRDLDVLCEAWLTSDPDADYNADYIVNFADYEKFSQNW